MSELTPHEPAKRLYREVFETNSADVVAAEAADGIAAVIANVERLVTETEYLYSGGRVATASFMLATAWEELAKVFILMDACRLNPEQQGSTMRRLCQAFYDHIVKHAYNAVRHRVNVNSMAKAFAVWKIEVKRWWPESPDPEQGEPPMPHDTFFAREIALYVDRDWVTKRWIVPDNNVNAYRFDSTHWPSDFDRLRSELTMVKQDASNGLLSCGGLKIMNEVFGGDYVNNKTPETLLRKRNRTLVACLAEATGQPESRVLESVVTARPLYHFTTVPV